MPTSLAHKHISGTVFVLLPKVHYFYFMFDGETEGGKYRWILVSKYRGIHTISATEDFIHA